MQKAMDASGIGQLTPEQHTVFVFLAIITGGYTVMLFKGFDVSLVRIIADL